MRKDIQMYFFDENIWWFHKNCLPLRRVNKEGKPKTSQKSRQDKSKFRKKMKKIILAAFVAASSLAANAQVWMGGSLGFDVTDYEDGAKSEMTVQVAPEVGYTLNENWDVAVALNLSMIQNGLGVKDANVTEFAVSPYARYTFAKSGIASFFVDGVLSFGSHKPKGVDATTSFGIGLRPGVKVALSEKVCLVSSLGQLGYKSVKDHYNKFGLGVDNTAINFGLYWAF